MKMIRTLHLRSVREVDTVPSSLKAPVIASDPPAITPDPPIVPSEQREAPHTDDSVRDPWMPSESVITVRYGRTVPPNVMPLYVGSRFVDDAEAVSKHFEPMTNQRRDYYISLFHELRYWSSKKASGRSRVPEGQALSQSWNQFAEKFNKGSTAYRDRVASARERFMKYSVTSVVQRVYEGSVNESIPCAVPVGIHCPHSPPGASRISERDLTGYTTNRVPANVKELRAKLACARQLSTQHSARHCAPQRYASSPWWASYALTISGTSVIKTFRGKPRISKETRLSPTNTKTNRTSVRLRTGMVYNPIHLAVDRTADRDASVGGGGRSSYGQPHAHSLQSLHARVEALESVQAAQIAELKQQLNLQKAYVAEAAQTTSNIRVEISEQVRLLR
ncbi:LOW QUALITY PROTEIN: hypothetical protein PHMEG_00033723 [Phytophthora megakarya]|uniref:Uncharacterized protein n=1 Tax=Phytophthora megakarya TaxID=4795 RepID=A0A225UV64_9STRA|nr:LOW QUALITY PROTEIN: hypothetical protein PHMEG_00033723 [Phytophthora megakarya]